MKSNLSVIMTNGNKVFYLGVEDFMETTDKISFLYRHYNNERGLESMRRVVYYKATISGYEYERGAY